MFSKSSLYADPSDLVAINAEKVVIIGDGPIALAEALALKNRGVNVSLVGPRLGEYTRSGDHVREKVTGDVSKLIAPYEINDTPGNQIKDIERDLYKIICDTKKLKIPILKQAFSKFFDKKSIEVIDKKNNKKTVVPVDLVIDCTGVTRACIKQVNEIHEGTFTITTVPGNSQISYAMVRMIMPLKDYYCLGGFRRVYFKEAKGDISMIEPSRYVAVIKELRELGWEHYAIPDFYGNHSPKKVRDSDDPSNESKFTIDKNFLKVNFYTELPSGMSDPEKIQKFVKILLKLCVKESTLIGIISTSVVPKEKYKLELDDFDNLVASALLDISKEPNHTVEPTFQLHDESKKPNKPMISAFAVTPAYTTPGFYLGDSKKIPPTFHLGDATSNLPFYMGEGIRNGVRQCLGFNASLIIQGGKIAFFNRKKYENSFKEHITIIDRSLLKIYKQISELREEAKSKAMKQFRSVYDKSTDPLEQRKALELIQEWDVNCLPSSRKEKKEDQPNLGKDAHNKALALIKTVNAKLAMKSASLDAIKLMTDEIESIIPTLMYPATIESEYAQLKSKFKDEFDQLQNPKVTAISSPRPSSSS